MYVYLIFIAISVPAIVGTLHSIDRARSHGKYSLWPIIAAWSLLFIAVAAGFWYTITFITLCVVVFKIKKMFWKRLGTKS